MRCSSYCLGQGLLTTKLFAHLKDRGYQPVQQSESIYYVFPHHRPEKLVCYFSQGSMVTWNINKRDAEKLVSDAFPFITDPINQPLHDDFSFQYAKKTKIEPHDYFNIDMIYLESEELELRLAISYALAQSVKLQLFDSLVQKIFSQYEPIIKATSLKGKIRLNRQKLRKIVATIVLLRSQLNVGNELLTIPKFFWKYSSYEKDYLIARKFLDLESRVAGLNQKTEVISDMLNMFTNEIQHAYFSTLEVIIIAMIGVEILVSLPKLW
jgi:uncharacterized Rmd1/YagE family protein